MPPSRWNDDRLDSLYKDLKQLDLQVETLDRMIHENRREIKDAQDANSMKVTWWLMAATWASPIATLLILILRGK